MIPLLKTAGKVLALITPKVIEEVIDYVEKVKNREDVTDHWVRSKIPSEQMEIELQDEILTEARKEAGLPT